MKFKNTLIVAILLVATNNTYAQYSGDAFRFSQFSNSGTARFDALGGNKSAVGGDLSSLYGNPAGLGMFTKSEFNLTPSLNLRNGDITFSGNQKSYSGNNADLNNVGVVFHTLTSKTSDTKKGLLSLNFGIGYQRKNTFKNDFNFKGTSNLNGISDFFTENSNREGLSPTNLVSEANYAAYYSFLTNYKGGKYQNITYADADQAYTVRRSGGGSSIDFSFGANVSNKVFLGASLGLASFKYTSIEKTNEIGLYINPSNNATKDYNVDYTRNFDSNGSGINLKLGLILKPVNEFRIGLSFESPTWYSVTDNYTEELYDNKQSYSGKDSYPFEYKLNTPLKLNGGLAYFFGSKGFISADVGFVDYSNIRFKSNDNTVSQTTNNNIQKNYKNVINYSVGGEYNVNNSLLLRLGYKSDGNPYYNLDNKDFTANSYSGGFGYRFGVYYFDLALINSNAKLYYSNYTLNSGNEPIATINTRRNTISLTFGLRF
nr:outer membrane protein transport protein [Pseudopedobacter sp.]